MTGQPAAVCPAATWAGLSFCATCPTPEPGQACARKPDELLRRATAAPSATPQPHITDTHTWDGTHHLPDWLHHDGHRLTLPGRDDNTPPQPGWMLVRWSDGQVTVASPQVAARVYGPDGMRGRLERAEAELADRDAAESADAAAGSYANGSEHAIADPARWLHVTFTSPDPTTANTSALAIADHLRAEFPGVGMRITSNAVESESVIVCTTACDEQHTYDWTCAQFAGTSDESARTTPDNPAASSALAEQLRTAIEHEVYEYRERTMLWGETEGVTEEITRLATRGALSILQANPAPIRDLIDTALRTTPRADCADWPAREAHGQGHRYDMRCALCAGEADTLTDAVLAALQLRPEPVPADTNTPPPDDLTCAWMPAPPIGCLLPDAEPNPDQNQEP